MTTVVIIALVVAQFVTLRLVQNLARYAGEQSKATATLTARVESLERGVKRG